MPISKLEKEINEIWKKRDTLSSKSNKKITDTIDKTINLIDTGKIRVAEKTKNKWKVNEWIKKAILLSFRVNEQKVISGGPGSCSWWDKVPSKFSNWKKKDFFNSKTHNYIDIICDNLLDTIKKINKGII